ALIDTIVSDRGISDAIVDAQDAALQRLLKKDFAGTVLGYVHRVLAMPQQEAPIVAPNFWEQFEMSARLGEIRKYRPSAYRALPKRAASSPTPTLPPQARGEGKSEDADPRAAGRTRDSKASARVRPLTHEAGEG